MITIKKMTFGYLKKHPLFLNLNLTINEGRICGLLGKNGAGKTTLLKILAGLLFPNEGSCKVLNEHTYLRQPQILSNIYYLSEEIFVPDMTIGQYIDSYSRFYPNFDNNLLSTFLKQLNYLENEPLTKFSYGEKKKFLIAFALATRCRLLILDEPTNGLDIPSKAQFRKLIASSISKDQLFIISTHQVHDVENLIESVIILDEGEIILHSDIDRITDAICFEYSPLYPDEKNSLYYEKDINGYKIVKQNISQEHTQPDLELLFKATLQNKNQFKTLFGENKCIKII